MSDVQLIDMLQGRGPVTMTLRHVERAIPLLVLLPDGREAVRVNPDGDVVIASDLTLDDAKWVIERLAMYTVEAGRQQP